MIIYFSGTGNSKYVADILAEKLSDETVNAGQMIKAGRVGDFTSEKPYILCFPSYLSTIPKIFADFISASSLNGCKKVYAIGTCMGSIGIAPNVIKAICDNKGMIFCGAEKILMPQNYIALFNMTEDAEIAKRQAEAIPAVTAFAEAILRGDCLNLKLAAKPEYALTSIVEKMYIGPFTKTKKFYATDKCIGCGLCAKNCPVNKIHIDTSKKPKWEGSCVHCMACINRCPVAAIEYGKKTQNKKRYVCREYK